MKSGATMLPINLSRRIVEANEAINTIQTDVMKCNLDILKTVIQRATESGQAIANCIAQSNSDYSTRSNIDYSTQPSYTYTYK